MNNHINTHNVSRQDTESCRKALNQLITERYPDKGRQNRLLSEMEMALDENIIPLERFDWVKLDERATFWLWGHLYQVSDFRLGIPSPPDAKYDDMNWYKRNGLPHAPSSHQERVSIIIDFFDNIIVTEPRVEHRKHQVLDKLKDQWKTLYNKPLPLKWLPDEEDAALWAWEHIQKVQQKNIDYSRSNYLRFKLPGLTTWFTPLNHAERYLALRAALDLWDDAPDTKRLFLLNLNKAWNQQKLRRSRTDKKALNTYLKNETKTRLDLMAEHSGVRISDMLEKIINEHYRKMVGGE
ncbi:hypothetical protein MF265_21755 [Serratia marcescens]|uniref:RepB family protein n=1 Tax=Serratia marcescens TaxID=615 RepID=UPI001EF0131D|nr:RepB family protein [Serratia marcescens]ULH10517.1 hypothetical protein MF265_21755 [Serratia marcescens]